MLVRFGELLGVKAFNNAMENISKIADVILIGWTGVKCTLDLF